MFFIKVLFKKKKCWKKYFLFIQTVIADLQIAEVILGFSA